MSVFANIFAQDSAIEWLRQAMAADRLPHALIFAGPQGVGKATTAAALARWFLCDKPTGDSACGKCEGCRGMASGNHPDFHVITKELIRYYDKTGTSKAVDLSIKVIRPELVEKASRKSVMGRGKVFLIEQAELMNSAAQNAMLKTLEEPAGRTLIILLSDQAGSLLPTIRSRCQTVRFAYMDVKRVVKELTKRGISPDLAQEAAHLSGGSLGRALAFIADDIIDPARKLTQMLDALLAGARADDLPAWFKTSGEAYAAKQLERDELASKDQANRAGLSLYLSLAADHLRRRLSEQADGVDYEPTCAAIDAIVQSELYLDGNVNVALIFQHLASKLTRESATA